MEAMGKVRLAACVALAWGMAVDATAQPQWEVLVEGSIGTVRWERGREARPAMADSPSGPIVSVPREAMNAAPHAVRISPSTGLPLWRAALPYQPELGRSWEQSIIAGPAGTSLVIGMAVTRLAADGTPMWSAAGEQDQAFLNGDQVDAAVVLDDGSVVLAARRGGSTEFRHLDAATGVPRAVLAMPSTMPSDSCRVLGMTHVGTTAYAVGGCPRRLVKLDADPLRSDWNTPVPFVSTSALLHADETGVYVASGVEVRKFDHAVAHPIWTVARPSTWLESISRIPDGPLMTRSGSTIEALDAATGASLWSYVEPGHLGGATMSGTSLLVVGDEASSSGGATSAYVAELDPSSGNVMWRNDVAAAGWDDIRFDDATRHGDDVVVLGTRCRETPVYGEACEVTMWRGSAAPSSAYTANALTVTSGLVGTLVADEAPTVLAVSLEWSVGGQQLHVREYRMADGVLVGESVHPAALPVLDPFAATYVEARRGADGSITVLYKAHLPWLWGFDTDAVIVKIAGASGPLLWQRALFDTNSEQIGVDASLASVDSQGNVLLSVHEGFPEQPFTGASQDRRSIRKLASTSGDVLWQKTFSPVLALSFQPPSAYAIGDDLLVFETPEGDTWSGIARIAGSDGHMLWSFVPPAGGGSTDVSQPGAVLHMTSTSPFVITRLDAATGAVSWSTTHEAPPGWRYYPYRVVGTTGPGARYVLSGRRWEPASTGPSPTLTRGFAMALDAASGAVAWSNDLQENPFDAISAVNPRAIVDGVFYASQGHALTTSENVFALTGFDMATGTAIGIRPTLVQSYAQPHRDDLGGYFYGMTAQGVLLGSPLHIRHDAPPSMRLARHALAPTARGDLRVTLDATPAVTNTGLKLLVGATTFNVGPDTASGVDAQITLPRGAVVEDVTCAIDGATCTAIVTPTSIEARVSIAANATLTLSARAGVRSDAPYRFEARSLAPFSFMESRLGDNFAATSYTDTILRHGFD